MKRTWKIIGISLGVLIVVLALIYAVVSRDFFVRNVILPRVATALDVEITAETIDFSPFRKLEMTGLKVIQPGVFEFSTDRMRCQYRLESVLNGPLEIASVTVDNGSLQATLKTGEAAASQCRLHGLTVAVRNLCADGIAELTADGRLEVYAGDALSINDARIAVTAQAALDNDLRLVTAKAEAALELFEGQIRQESIQNSTVELTTAIRARNAGWEVENLLVQSESNDRTDVRLQAKGTVQMEPVSVQAAFTADPISATLLNAVTSFAETDIGIALAQDARASGQVVFGESGRLQGQIQVSMPGLELFANQEKLLENVGLTADIQAEMDLQAKTLVPGKFDVTLSDVHGSLLDAHLLEPEAVPADAVGMALEKKLRVTMSRLPLAAVSRYTRSDQWQISDGTLNGVVDFTFSPDGGALMAEAALAVENLGLTVADYEMRNVTVSQSLTATARNFMEIDVAAAETVVKANGSRVLRLQQRAAGNLQSLTGRYEMEITDVTPALQNILPPAWLTNLDLRKLAAHGRVSALREAADMPAELQADLAITDFLMLDKTYGLIGPGTADVSARVNYAAGVLSVKGVSLLAKRLDQQVAQLAVSGTVAVPLDSAPSTLSITSTGADLGFVVGILGRLSQSGQPAQRVPGQESRPHQPPLPPAPPETPVDRADIHLTAGLDMKNLRYQDIDISECKGTIVVDNSIITADPLALIINGAPLSLAGQIDLGTPGYAYRLSGSLGKLDIAPFLDAFSSAAVSRKVKGEIADLNFAFSGRGTAPAAVRKNLTGTCDLGLGRLELHNIEALQETARKWQLPELRTLIFEKAGLKTEVADGIATIKELFLAGPDLQVNADGYVGLDQSLSLTAVLGVGGGLLQNLTDRGLGSLLIAGNGAYRRLPVEIPVQGNLKHPRVKFSLDSLFQQALKAKGTAALQEALGAAARKENIDPGEILKSILGEERSSDESQGTPPAGDDGKDNLREQREQYETLFRGLLKSVP
jgi:hypothetical protein